VSPASRSLQRGRAQAACCRLFRMLKMVCITRYAIDFLGFVLFLTTLTVYDGELCRGHRNTTLFLHQLLRRFRLICLRPRYRCRRRRFLLIRILDWNRYFNAILYFSFYIQGFTVCLQVGYDEVRDCDGWWSFGGAVCCLFCCLRIICLGGILDTLWRILFSTSSKIQN
jgi:hypothetical protein